MQVGLRRIKKAKAGAARQKMADELRRYVEGWAAAFKLCTCIQEIRDGALEDIAELM